MFNLVLSIINVFLSTSFSPLFLFLNNVDQATIFEILHPLLLVNGISFIVFILFIFLIKDFKKAAIVTALFSILFANYKYIELVINKIFPFAKYWHIVPVLIIILIYIGILFKRLSKDLTNVMLNVSLITFTVLIMINLVPSIPVILDRISIQSKVEIDQSNNGEKLNNVEVNGEKLPNIYLLLFDEYSPSPFMKKYYNYDSSFVGEELNKLGFSVSETGHNTYPSTVVVTTQLFNLDESIVDENTPEYKCLEYRENNLLVRQAQQHGYTLNGVGYSYFYGVEPRNAGDSITGAQTMSGETMDILFLKNTPLYPFVEQDSYPLSAKLTKNNLEYLSSEECISLDGGVFTISHLLLPHEPFYFNANGDLNSKVVSDWKDKNYYLHQYKFTSDQIIKIANNLVSNDPESIIIIMSDHSARAASDPDLSGVWFSEEDKTNFFNAVYLGGKTIKIDGLSGVDTLKLVFQSIMNFS